MIIAFKSSFLKAIKKLKDVSLQEAIFEVINHVEQVENLTDIKNIKKLKGYSIYYRIRVGNYRIGLKWEETEGLLYFVTFEHRKDIYNKFP